MALERSGDPYYDAPVVILVFASPTSTHVLDGAAAMMNMLLAAETLGLGACWIHASGPYFETPAGRQMRSELGLPDTMIGLESLALGYIDGDKPSAKEHTEPTEIL